MLFYLDDRMYVLEVSFVTTSSPTTNEPSKQEWVVTTRRNVVGYPPRRCDTFPTFQEAMDYVISVEPSTPRVSLNGAWPNPVPTYEGHLAWLRDQGIDDSTRRM
jgi:hypothetical protein